MLNRNRPGRGWVNTVDLRPGDRIDTASADDLVVTSLSRTGRIERTYNLTVEGWHTFLVGEDRAVVHNSGWCDRLARDATGRIHGSPLPNPSDLRGLSRDDLEFAAGELRQSIANRQANMLELGNQGGHGVRLEAERQLLRSIQRMLGQ